MEINQKENELHVYPINENEFIGAFNASFHQNYGNYLVLIIDCSSAGGLAAERLLKEVVPLVMKKVEYYGTYARVITFGNESISKSLSPTDLTNLNVKSGGAANIGSAIENLRLYLQEGRSKSSFYAFNVLTISAGEISDRDNAERESKKLISYLATVGWRINSQAVRLFTTSNDHQPDTKALSYLLQINNATEAKICDINMTSTNETIANEIAVLFPENVTRSVPLHLDKPIILRFPWESSQWGNFLVRGCNIFWMNQLPATDSVKFTGNPINVVVEGQLTLAKFQQLMEKKLPQIISHMTILKIVGTAEANETVNQIFSYFAKTEEALAVKCSTTNNKIITNAVARIAMYRADFRNSDEIYEFYRNPTKSADDQIEKDRLKEEEEKERLKREEEERRKREEEERLQREEEERLKREEEERLKRKDELQKQKEVAAAQKTDSNNDPNSVQMIFIFDEHSSLVNESRRFTEEIVPLMVVKFFAESWQRFQSVTFLRYEATTAQTLQSLVRALDATKRIRISLLTNRELNEGQEVEEFAKVIEEFLNESGYSFEVQVMRLAPPEPKRYKLVDIDNSESNEFIAEQILSNSIQ